MKLRKLYKELINKENKTLYDQLYIKAYNDEADELLEQYIYNIKNKKIYDFNIYPQVNYIVICYSYKGYDIYFNIFNDKYISYIDAPEKFDYVEERKEFEKKEITTLNFNTLNSMEEFFLLIYEKIKTINDKIDIFNKTIKLSILTNGKLLNNLYSYKHLCKVESFVGLFGGIFVCGLGVIFLITLLNDKTLFNEYIFRDLFELFLILLWIIFGIFVFINSIFWTIKLIQIKKDNKYKELSKFSGEITKVKLIIDPGYKSPISTLCAINITAKNETAEIRNLICPIGSCFVKGKLNKRKLKNKYLGRKIEVMFLKHSKVCVNGLSNIFKNVSKETARAK